MFLRKLTVHHVINLNKNIPHFTTNKTVSKRRKKKVKSGEGLVYRQSPLLQIFLKLPGGLICSQIHICGK